MVVWKKIVPLVAVGACLLFLVNAFTRPAQASQTASAIQDSISSIGVAGDSISSLGRGIGSGLAGLFQPLWEISNLFERFSSLSSGSANVGPVTQVTAGGNDAPTWTWSGGGSSSGGSSGYTASASDTGGGTLTSGSFGGKDTSSGWGL